MGTVVHIIGGYGRPLFLGIAILVILGMLGDETGKGTVGSNGFECRGFTTNAELNRVMCRYHPAKIWNMPLGDIFPFLKPNAPAGNDLPAGQTVAPQTAG
ncbi:hypothetical protein R3X27_18665 [Tropicimonas sp. TH_r6]|uniref:hypothetical protein n=1 Tax=Tropicimonas sp. TH_r6 TaxID=3082085 RepID=UPI0029542FA9|nr:hypothetical protein [Tropicimonas sp. TH_r6]MDV7144708.1 hypothetical protein [Tropicimonas sp. TH_r6]